MHLDMMAAKAADVVSIPCGKYDERLAKSRPVQEVRRQVKQLHGVKCVTSGPTEEQGRKLPCRNLLKSQHRNR